MRTYIFTLLLFLLTSEFSYSQSVASLREENAQASSFFLFQKNYLAAKTALYESDSEDAAQIDYLKAISQLKNGDEIGIQLLKNFVEKYPKHPMAITAYVAMTRYFFHKKEYLPLLEYIKPFEDDLLKKEVAVSSEYLTGLFQIGYAYFMQKKYTKAREIWSMIDKGIHQYVNDVNYYLGIIACYQKEYEKAIQSFHLAVPKYQMQVDEWICKILYEQKKYPQVISYFEDLQRSKRPITPALNLFVGSSYFQKQDYSKTAVYLKKYLSESEKLSKATTRKVALELGTALYLLSNHTNTSDINTFLRQAADGKDETAQWASYLLALSYIKTNQKELALDVLDACRKQTYQKKIQAKAAFLYAKVHYEIKHFNETVNAADFFYRSFPKDSRNPIIKKLQAQALQYTGDYQNALLHYEAIANKDREVKTAYQRLSYNQGVQQYNDGQYDPSLESLKKALKYPTDKDLNSTIYYFIGEIFNRKSNYKKAIAWYQKIPASSPYYAKAQYSVGYILYNQKQYVEALQKFEYFVSHEQDSTRKAFQRDALLRIADCYYVLNNYNYAALIYDQVLEFPSSEKDYIYFQKARIYEQKKDYEKAQQLYTLFLINYPNSSQKDEVRLYKGLLELRQEKYSESVGSFTDLIDSSSKRKLVPLARMKRSLAYQALNNFLMASLDLKIVLREFPNHPVAEDAIKSLQTIHREQAPVDSLESYRDLFRKFHPDSDFEIADKFKRAKKYIFQEQFTETISALLEFTNTYPASKYTSEAYYWLGYCLKREGDWRGAEKAFLQVQDVRFIAKATKNLADIYFQNQLYTKAIQKYVHLQGISSRKKYIHWADLQLMKCYFAIGDFSAVDAYVKKIKESKSYQNHNEAHLYHAKTLLAQEKYQEALLELENLTKSASEKSGAEGQYLIGVIHRKLGNFEESTEQLIQVKKKYESYPQWVYQAYLLIADNYVSSENIFHAKRTLNSIIENAKDSTAILKAKEKLAILDQKEN